ncbi:MAG: dTDP-4-dehydrorhamnose reductase [Spirochaetes bacterium GWB1_36_13]|nr:MAG: dTDP-4-dehydrorhamnose reductase [Spirochaetes bacterium GWB1_36_13]
MIWLVGNKGMLGQDVEKKLRENQIEYFTSDIEIDITHFDSLEKAVSEKTIEWIINCSAYTAVDKAEDEKEKAFLVNGEGVFNLAKITGIKKAKLIHVSTDYVFNGEKKEAYLETDSTDPIGVYGTSKLAGEKNIQKLIHSFFIVRTAWLYGKNGNNFVSTMLRLFKEREEVKIVHDQFGSPTYTQDLASFILTIIQKDSRDYGIYHYTNEGKTTWYEFGKKIYELGKKAGLLEKEIKITPISTDEYPTKAKRPKNSYLSKEKAKKAFHIQISDWETALENFINEVKNEES